MILPEDIQKQQFEVSFRGYSTREVDDFLDRLHSDLEEIMSEQEILKRKIAAAELIAKDAKDHEEEFIASMQEDKAKSEAALAAAKAEGERIIREAKNAASGIMAEVRRRAGDISTESRKASSDILEEARAEAEKLRTDAVADAAAITDEAKAEADRKLYAARTEADNIVKAARTEAESITSEATARAEAVTKAAAESAAVHEEYIKEVRAAAEKLCFEIDTELKNSASRIALLGRRISSTDIPERTPEVTDTVADEPARTQIAEPKRPAKPVIVPTHAVSVPEEDAPSPETDTESGIHGKYFSHEYKLAMTELFGEDADTEIPSGPITEDDDTYDYLDHINTPEYSMSSADDDTYDYDGKYGYDEDEDDNDEDDSEEGEDDGIVTSEYSGIPTTGRATDLHDVFTDDALDRVFKSPTQSDIDDILNGQ